VITVQKDSSLPKHHILDVPNIHALDALKSLASRGFVRVTFNWCVRRRGGRAAWCTRAYHDCRLRERLD
jgi:hypothetical protein